MRTILCALQLLALVAPLYSEPREIVSIRSYYNDLMQKIRAGSIYSREMRLTYETIPGIGAPSSLAKIFYDMASDGAGEYAVETLRIENWYQHAGRAFCEEFVFRPGGALIFYFGRAGSGDITRPDAIEWAQEERFYFSGGRLVRIMRGRETSDRPSAGDARQGAARLQRGRQLRDRDCSFRMPAPFLFNE